MAKMTLDNLAIIIKREFDRVNKKLNDHDEQFEKIDKKFKNYDQEFRQINNKLDSMQADVLSIKNELVDMSRRLDKLEKRTLEDDNVLVEDVLELRKRVRTMERKIIKLQASKK